MNNQGVSKHLCDQAYHSDEIFRVWIFCIKITALGDFPGGPVDENLPCNAGDMGSIPGWGTKIPHAAGQLSSGATMKDPA